MWHLMCSECSIEPQAIHELIEDQVVAWRHHHVHSRPEKHGSVSRVSASGVWGSGLGVRGEGCGCESGLKT